MNPHVFYLSPLIAICFFLSTSAAENQTFAYPNFTLRNITLLGDSFLRDGAIGLTRELAVPSTSAGTAICNAPIKFFDRKTNASASFFTKFSFTISTPNQESSGDGLTFFLSSDNRTLGSPGGYLGLFNSSAGDVERKIIAVEFDTRMNVGFDDPDSNHVGLDIQNGPVSVRTADLNASGINLKSGNQTTAWIDYNNDQNVLTVWLSYSNSKPDRPVLSVNFDLSSNFDEVMYAGFSAATEGSTEVHMVENWSFETSGFPSSNSSLQQQRNNSGSKQDQDPGISVPTPNYSHKAHKKLRLVLEITIPVVFSAILVVCGWLFFKIFKKWKKTRLDKHLKPDMNQMIKGPREFSYKELSYATRGFHASRVLGNGAFGTVYKATLPTGVIFAVKRSKHTHQGQSEFLAELSIIACLRHKNLVQLEGWCCEKSELLLVYEFMSNGSLDKMFYQEPKLEGSLLRWPHRYNIAVGIASALKYLHQECEQQVIHRDIKTSNIMLDNNFNPRLGDFGLARITDHDKSPVSTLTAGTMGYLAPEYLQYGKATEKTDVYSYGVVVLEIACGRQPIEKDASGQMTNLADWVWRLYSEDKLMEAVDWKLNSEYDKDDMRRLLLVGLSCVHPNFMERPSMSRVLQILNNEAEPLVVPRKKPVLVFCNSLPLSIQEIVSEVEGMPMPNSFHEPVGQ